MAEIMQCSWATGTNLINSTPTAPEDAWTSVTGEAAGKWEKLTDAAGWNGESHYAHHNDNNSLSERYVVNSDLAHATVGVRFGFYLDAESLASGNVTPIAFGYNAGWSVAFYLKLKDDTGQLQIEGTGYDNTNTARVIGVVNINLDTWYQIELLWQQNTVSGFRFKVWNEAGTSLIGSEQILDGAYTTQNSNMWKCYLGSVTADWVQTEYRMDIVLMDDAGYPGPQVAAGGETRNLLASIVGSSMTPDVAATIARALLSNIGGVSATPDVAAIVQRAMIAGIAVQSLTPDIAAAVVRALIADIPGASLTPDIAAAIERAMTANVAGVSATSDISAAVARVLLSSIPGSSLTPDISITIARALAANIAAVSYTPDITATIQGQINLIANITGSSITPDVAPTVVRALIVSIQAQSATADAIASITRSLIANIAALSTTPDITATLENVVNLSAAIAGVSLTPDISMTIARTLAGLIAAESVTSDVSAAVARSLIANIQGTSLTPDDLILILAGLGIILDPTIVSVTPRRVYESITTERIYQSMTPVRTIENL